MSELEKRLKAEIRDVPDFPKAGIVFKDITPLLQNPETLGQIIDGFDAQTVGFNYDVIFAVESRGFIFGTPLGLKANKGVVLVRKPGKLPSKTEAVTYELEYGTDTLEVHSDAIAPGDRVLIVDDLLATGGTAKATCDLVEKLGGVIAGLAFVIELDFLKGRESLPGPIVTLVHY